MTKLYILYIYFFLSHKHDYRFTDCSTNSYHVHCLHFHAIINTQAKIFHLRCMTSKHIVMLSLQSNGRHIYCKFLRIQYRKLPCICPIVKSLSNLSTPEIYKHLYTENKNHILIFSYSLLRWPKKFIWIFAKFFSLHINEQFL